MSARPVISPDVPRPSLVEPATRPRPVSRPKVSVQRSGTVLHLPQFSSVEFRHWFAPKLAEFLQANFRNPEAVARMFLMFPQAVAWFLTEWEGR